MNLPIQSQPVMRNVSTAKILGVLTGVNPAQNLKLQCDLCCQMGGVNCNSIIPGCVCPF